MYAIANIDITTRAVAKYFNCLFLLINARLLSINTTIGFGIAFGSIVVISTILFNDFYGVVRGVYQDIMIIAKPVFVINFFYVSTNTKVEPFTF
jgi:hypothetical protein